MIKSAKLRRAGVHFVEKLVKEAQLHPVEAMRQGAAWNVGLKDLWGEYGINPEDEMAAQRTLASNPEYFQRMRSLYDKVYGQAEPTMSEVAAARKKPANISAENAPKVVSAPK